MKIITPCTMIFLGISSCLLISLVSSAQNTVPVPVDYLSTVKKNYVRTIVARAPVTDPADLLSRTFKDVQQTTQYLDGLGRPIETVVKEGSLTTGSSPVDMVSALEYDELGRERFKYLPFASNNGGSSSPVNDGNFKFNPFQQQATFMGTTYGAQGESFFYGKSNFEASPRKRITENYAPGNSWVGSESQSEPQRKNTQVKYYSNTDIDDVKIWEITNGSSDGDFGSYFITGFYPAGTLYKTITIDENKKQVIEFKDKDGKALLKKVQLGEYVGDNGFGTNYADWLCTYYLYDDFNNLRAVFQPMAVDYLRTHNWSPSTNILNEFTFRYEYDYRNRMIRKQVPGAASVFMVYDARDRLVLTQDGNLNFLGKWAYIKYDILNRPESSGLWPSTLTWAQQADNAKYSTIYPSLSGEEILSQTFYDNYNWLSPNGYPFSPYRGNEDDADFQPASSSYPYHQAPQQTSALIGMITGTKTKVLGTNTFLFTINFYDEKGRVIQTKSQNITSGIDVNSIQYNWAGQPTTTTYRQQKNISPVQTNVVSTQLNYDDLGRLLESKKKVYSVIAGDQAVTKSWSVISTLEYDALGQLKNKKLGNKPFPAGSPALVDLSYEYNIRGWLLSLNKDYVLGGVNNDQYFGMQLGYDKDGLGSFTKKQHNGNIAGTIWRSFGDGVNRKYDFDYDNANRIIKADFTQKNNAAWNVDEGIDFSVVMGNTTITPYDANGNIQVMQQKGLKINSSMLIDNLVYSYVSNESNRLASVTDAIATDNKLGDFKDAGNNGVDYDYDLNGNLKLDNNKSISAITYNHLNLPQTITLNGKGNISYTYDANGSKLKKETIETPSAGNAYHQITTTTKYIGGSVYESKTFSPAYSPTRDYIDVLQFFPHEEGRIRYKPKLGTALPSFEYDYFIKDHLGNVRMLLTEEYKPDIYPAATLEPGLVAIEDDYYAIDESKIVLKSSIPGMYNYSFPNNNGIANNNPNCSTGSLCTTDNSASLYKLNSNTNKTGLGITLKVMAGDKIDVFGKSYYFTNTGGTSGNNPVPVLNLLDGFLNTPTGATLQSGHGQITSSILNTTTGVASILQLINQQNSQSNASPNKPRSFINVIFFNEQFKSENFSLSMVGSNSELKDHYSDLQNLIAQKSGYVYIYCSNESPVDVFFDNIQVVHTRGPVLEETHYYPFGLTMAGISSKAANISPNKENTFQNQRFDDDLGLNWVQFKWRNHDPQIGRFIEIDPLANEYVYNSTYAFSENCVTGHVELEGLEKSSINPVVDAVVNKVLEWTADLTAGAQNVTHGAVEKANAITGGNENLPSPVQQLKSLSADLQMNAGVAQMVKPGLEAASYVAGVAIGLEIPATSGLVSASNFGLKGSVSLSGPSTLGGVTNTIPSEVSRVIPNSLGKVNTLGNPGATDVFVTASSDIKGLSSSQISNKLTIPQSNSGFQIITFPTPQGIASPINRATPGFIGGGRTAGGAREFVIPNTSVPPKANIQIVN